MSPYTVLQEKKINTKCSTQCFITAYHEQLLILGAFLPSSLDVLIEIIFLFVCNGGKISWKTCF